jgi:hypothetical protein
MIVEEVEQADMCHHTDANKAGLLKVLMTPMMDGSNSNACARNRIEGISIIFLNNYEKFTSGSGPKTFKFQEILVLVFSSSP